MSGLIKKWKRVAALSALAAVFLPIDNAAAEFPDDTITVTMPFNPGGTGDIILRKLGEIMQEDLSQSIVVVNRPGSGGAVGWTLLQSEKPDGYNIGYASSSLFLQTYKTKGSLDYQNFVPIVALNSTPFAITVNAESPWETIEEFVAYAKENPRKVRLGNGGTGSIWHISGAVFENAAGIELTHVPFKSGAEAASSLLGNHIEATSVNVAEVAQLVDSGQLRLLAIGGTERDPFYPDVPTTVERGIDATLSNWRGVAAPKGVSEDRINILADAFEKALQDPRWAEFAENEKLTTEFDRGQSLDEFWISTGKKIISISEKIENNQ